MTTQLIEQLNRTLDPSYRLDRQVGAGGMATVWLAEDLRHRRKVAVKVLNPELSAILGTERFLQEIELTAGLQHPHILPLFDSGRADGILYYVMPYIDGESLRQRLIRGGPLPIADAVRILRDVADALAHAHTRGVVHRDIKPENVMLSDRHALVADFGIAKALTEAAGKDSLTVAGAAVGTPAYMSPEQASADQRIDHRSDIYAFGVLAYEILAGRPPFEAVTARGVLVAHLTSEPASLASRRADVPARLAAVVHRCLEKDPQARWQSADDILAELEGLAASGIDVASPSAKVNVAKHAPRQRTRFIIAASAAALGIFVVAAWLLRRATATPSYGIGRVTALTTS
ncbi:MAG: serine/threonine protein kinase, partial [Gemmatimonadota bacterium]|nr:serine/threonine protein kinase [Gemmatimonadota bacterium]